MRTPKAAKQFLRTGGDRQEYSFANDIIILFYFLFIFYFFKVHF